MLYVTLFISNPVVFDVLILCFTQIELAWLTWHIIPTYHMHVWACFCSQTVGCVASLLLISPKLSGVMRILFLFTDHWLCGISPPHLLQTERCDADPVFVHRPLAVWRLSFSSPPNWAVWCWSSSPLSLAEEHFLAVSSGSFQERLRNRYFVFHFKVVLWLLSLLNTTFKTDDDISALL